MIPRGLLRQYASSLIVIAMIIDIASVNLGALIAYQVRFSSFELSLSYHVAVLLASILTPIIFFNFGVYISWRGKRQIQYFRTLIGAWLTVILMLIVISFLTKTSESYSRQWIAYWAIFVSIIIVVYRILLVQILRYMREKGFNHKKIIIIGAGKLGKNILSHIKDTEWLGIDVVAFVDDKKSLHGSKINNVPVYDGIDNIIQFITSNKIDEVWIALPLRAESRVKNILEYLSKTTVTIRYIPNIFGFRLLNHSVSEVAGLPVLDLSSSPMVGINRLIKAIEDRTIALIILILISPLLLTIAILVKLTSPGPVLFKQLRNGWDGKSIKVYKFRSMVVHTEQDGAVTQATKDDIRVTKLGAFLRRTSLDELPQFINVLQGRMSIVGPRPHAIVHNEQYKDLIDDYMRRHKVKPGITGWAQVNGWRGEIDNIYKMKKRVEHDLYYIENWSLWFDLRIILMTIFKGFTGTNAY